MRRAFGKVLGKPEKRGREKILSTSQEVKFCKKARILAKKVDGEVTVEQIQLKAFRSDCGAGSIEFLAYFIPLVLFSVIFIWISSNRFHFDFKIRGMHFK